MEYGSQTNILFMKHSNHSFSTVLIFLLSIVVCLVLFTGCSENEPETEDAVCEQVSEFYINPDNLTFIKPDNGDAIFSMCTRLAPLGIDGFFDLEFSKVCRAFNSIGKVAPIINTDCINNEELKDLNEFHYQFLGLTINQEEHIYINAFILPEIDTIGTFMTWKSQLVDTCGGGKDFWGALLNLRSGEISNIQVNQGGDKAILNLDADFKLWPCTRCLGFDIEGYFLPSTDEVCLLEMHFDKIQDERATTCNFVGSKVPFSFRFLYQYMGVIIEGRKNIYINAFICYHECLDFDRIYYNGCDGGLGTWGILFDLENASFSNLQFDAVR